jgi:hypothetical protein
MLRWTVLCTVLIPLLTGCPAATLAGAGASTASAYWSYKSATVERVEVLNRECLSDGPVYLSRQSTLTRDDKVKLAQHNAILKKLCEDGGEGN